MGLKSTKIVIHSKTAILALYLNILSSNDVILKINLKALKTILRARF